MVTHTCRHCGQSVDCSDATDAREVAAILLAHVWLWCTTGSQTVDEPVEGRMIEP